MALDAYDTALGMRLVLGHDAVRHTWTRLDGCVTGGDRGIVPGIAEYMVDLARTRPRVWVLDDDRAKRERVDPAVDAVFATAAATPTLTVSTPSGGTHRYYLDDPDLPVRRHVGGGLDVLTNTCVRGPGSTRSDGGRYALTVRVRPRPPTLALVQAIRTATRTASPPRDRPAPWRRSAVLDPDDLDWSVGNRDWSMFRYVCSLAARGLSREGTLAAALEADRTRCERPLGEAAVGYKVDRAHARMRT